MSLTTSPDSYWDGGSWTSTAPGAGGNGSWADGSGSWNASKTANFGGTAGTVAVGTVTASKGLVFTTTGYTLSGGTITLAGASSGDNSIKADGAGAGFSATINSVIAGSAGLTKSGAGTLILSGNNTYSGGTTVSAGALLIDGTLTQSDVTVGSGATLGGHGTIQSLVTVQSGGTLSPGNSPGLLTMSSLVLDTGSTTLMQIIGSGSGAGTAGTDYDKLMVTSSGGASFGGILDLDFANLANFLDGTSFDLFGLSGSPNGTFSSVISSGSGRCSGLTFTGLAGVWQANTLTGNQLLTFTESTGQLVVSSNSVPEIDPAGMGSVLALVAGALGLFERRRLKIA